MPYSIHAAFQSFFPASTQIQPSTTGQSRPSRQDPHNLQRFLTAQRNRGIDLIEQEIRTGKVEHQWMWYVFPQVKGIADTVICNDYGIQSMAEAEAFFKHPDLGRRMMESLDSIDRHVKTGGRHEITVESIFGKDRAQKLKACVTLMAQATGDERMERFLKDHFGYYHPKTMGVLQSWPAWQCRPTSVDPYNLERFVDADPAKINRIVADLRKGHMDLQSIPRLFPQARQRGETHRTNPLGLRRMEDIHAYTSDHRLRKNLMAVMDALLAPRNVGVSAQKIFGPDGARQVETFMRFVSRRVDDTDLRNKAARILHQFFDGQASQARGGSTSVSASTTTECGPGQVGRFNPQRFLDAQAPIIENFVNELRSGRKQTHCMWYAFPQLEGLGKSKEARTYALRSMDDARLYLAEPLLRRNYERCLDALMDDRNKGRDALSILVNPIDVQKLQSSLTLFRFAADDDTLITKIDDVLARYFGHHLCQRTRDACLNQSMSR